MAEILKDAGNFEILTPLEWLPFQLQIIERAGRTCYQSVKGPITPKTAKRFARKILRKGHGGVLEHSLMTVQFNLTSRGMTHEQVRHRLTAVCQESTRYVDESNLQFVMPPHRDSEELIQLRNEDSELAELLPEWMTPETMAAVYELFYRSLLRSGWKPEDARQFLPIGTKSQIVVSANFREWLHIFKMRTSRFAHWEIRRIMGLLLEEVQPLLTPIFDGFELDGEDKHGLRQWKQVSRTKKKKKRHGSA